MSLGAVLARAPQPDGALARGEAGPDRRREARRGPGRGEGLLPGAVGPGPAGGAECARQGGPTKDTNE